MSNSLKFVEYFNQLAFNGTEDAQLKAAKNLADLSNDPAKRSKLTSSGGLDAIIHLVQSKNETIVFFAMKALVACVKDDKIRRIFISEKKGFTLMANLIGFFDYKIQVNVIKCVGIIAAEKYGVVKFVKEGTLQPLLGLLRPDQHPKVLLEALKTLSKVYLSHDIGIRIVFVWGLAPLKSLHKQYANNTDIVCNIAKTIANYATIEKLAVEMVQNYAILDDAAEFLQNKSDDVRKAAADFCCNLVNITDVRKAFIEHPIFIIVINGAHEKNSDVHHQLAKVQDVLCEKGSKNYRKQIYELVEKHGNMDYVEWIVKSIGCYSVKGIALDFLVSNDPKVAKAEFSSELVLALFSLTTNSIDLSVKQQCIKACYLLSSRNLNLFSETIATSPVAIHSLINFLTYNFDLMFKRYAVQTISHLSENPIIFQEMIKEGLISPAISCFLATNFAMNEGELEKETEEYFSNLVRIISKLSDFSEFRNEFRTRGGIKKILSTFDDVQASAVVILILRILVAFIANANKEGSGNADLKILNEKRIRRIVKLVMDENVKTGSMASDLLSAFSQHKNHPLENFWEIVISEMLDAITEHKKGYIFQKEYAFKILKKLFSKDFIFQSCNEECIKKMYKIYCSCAPLSIIRVVCGDLILIAIKKNPTVCQALLDKYQHELEDSEFFFYDDLKCKKPPIKKIAVLNEVISNYKASFPKRMARKLKRIRVMRELKKRLFKFREYLEISLEMDAENPGTGTEEAESSIAKKYGLVLGPSADSKPDAQPVISLFSSLVDKDPEILKKKQVEARNRLREKILKSDTDVNDAATTKSKEFLESWKKKFFEKHNVDQKAEKFNHNVVEKDLGIADLSGYLQEVRKERDEIRESMKPVDRRLKNKIEKGMNTVFGYRTDCQNNKRNFLSKPKIIKPGSEDEN